MENGTQSIRLSHSPMPGPAPVPAGLLGTGKFFLSLSLNMDDMGETEICLARLGWGEPNVTDWDAVRDEGLKRLLMSWYYAGYYTGYYEGQREPPRNEESGQR